MNTKTLEQRIDDLEKKNIKLENATKIQEGIISALQNYIRKLEREFGNYQRKTNNEIATLRNNHNYGGNFQK